MANRQDILTIIMSVMITVISSVSFSYAEYIVTQITDNDYDDIDPKINNLGNIVWEGYVYGQYNKELFSYNGTTQQMTSNSYDDKFPQINDMGFVVWQGNTFNYNIFLFDGVNSTQLTEGPCYNGEAQINHDGNLVWRRCPYDIQYFDGEDIIQISNSSFKNFNPMISDNGKIVWWGEDESDAEIFIYHNSSLWQFTDNDYDDMLPKISDNGNFVYQYWDGHDREIRFCRDDFGCFYLTDNDHDDRLPEISPNGKWVVWEEYSYGNIQFCEFIPPINWNCSSFDHVGPFSINDEGKIAWQDLTSDAILLYDGNSTKQISLSGTFGMNPKINKNGVIVWMGKNIDEDDYEIFMATESCGCITVSGRTYKQDVSNTLLNYILLILMPATVLKIFKRQIIKEALPDNLKGHVTLA